MKRSPRISPPSSGVSGTVEGTWTSKSLGRNVFEVTVDAKKRASWEFWALITSDRHWDSPKSDRKLQAKHLKQAQERNAAVIDMGDLLDLMGGRFDPRSYKGSIRREHNNSAYFDAVLNDAADWFSPYAQNIVVLGMGNHETAMTSRHEFNATERLIALLNSKTGSTIYNGGYSGWVQFNFQFEDGGPNSNKKSKRIVLNYHHGTSSGKSSSNILAHEKRAAYLPDANIVLSGHAHNFWSETVARLRLSRYGSVFHDTQLHLGCASYKDDIDDNYGGWATEKGFRPKPLGAWWIRFYWDAAKKCMAYEEIKAQ